MLLVSGMRPSHLFVRAGSILTGIALCLVAGDARAVSTGPEAPGPGWQWLSALTTRGDAPIALAQQASRRRFALADAWGVSVWRGGGVERASLEGVRDLAFDRDGTLWIATVDGLQRWRDSERPRRRSLRGGDPANRVHRLRAGTAGLVVATDAGAFWSSTGETFQRLVLGGVGTAVRQVAMQSVVPAEEGSASTSAASVRLFVLSEVGLFAVRGLAARSGLRVYETRRLTLPRPGPERAPVDLLLDPDASRLHLVFADGIATRGLHGADAAERRGLHGADAAERGWHFARPLRPPGARLRRLGWGGRRVWLATDHGLLEARSLAGPFVRASSPLGSSACVDVQGGERGSVVALCRRGVFLREAAPSEPVAGAGAAASRRRDPMAPDPPLAELRRRALERAGLDVARGRALRRGLARRAFWPELSLRLAADFERDVERDSDQSFVSGATRRLLDRRHDRSDGYSATIELDWDLGGVAYPQESVDLSRELRQVVSLRDDVADEINQLYFERQGIRERLLGGEALPEDEERRLRLRAAELEAGLDAWTGGWLSRWRAVDPSRAAASRPGLLSAPADSTGPDLPVERKQAW